MPTGTNNADRLVGSNGNDSIDGLGGNDTFVGSAGNDFLNGGDGIDTVDYSGLNAVISVKPTGVIDKAGLGTDQLFKVERIIGNANKFNEIDASTAGGSISIDMNLGQNSLLVKDVPGIGSLNLTVIEFDSVVGTDNADKIIGNQFSNLVYGISGNDSISGGAGDDTLVGCDNNDVVNGQAGNDRLLGTDANTSGFGEADTVIGGTGNDRFVVGFSGGSFYKFNGTTDRMKINDFSTGDLIEVGLGETYRTARTTAGFNLFAFRDGVKDLIAQVTTTSSINLPQGDFTIAAGQTQGIFTAAIY